MKYTLIQSGRCFEGSAHVLTDDEVQKLHKFKTENNLDNWVEMFDDLPGILEGYDPSSFITNDWAFEAALVNSSLHYVLLDENRNFIWDSKPSEWSHTEVRDTGNHHWSPDDKFEYHADVGEINDGKNFPQYTDAYPFDEKPNILFAWDEYKGNYYSFTIESVTQPRPTDFAHTTQGIEIPNDELEVVDKVFFKGQEIERESAEEVLFGKNRTVEVFTLEDVE